MNPALQNLSNLACRGIGTLANLACRDIGHLLRLAMSPDW